MVNWQHDRLGRYVGGDQVWLLLSLISNRSASLTTLVNSIKWVAGQPLEAQFRGASYRETQARPTRPPANRAIFGNTSFPMLFVGNTAGA